MDENITEVPEVEIADEERDFEAEVAKMKEARDEKVNNAISHLIQKVEVMQDQYKTASGIVASLNALKDAGCKEPNIVDAENVSVESSKVLRRMKQELICIEELSTNAKVTKLRNFCEGFYTTDIIKAIDDIRPFADFEHDAYILIAAELLILNICQVVGPAADDIASFITSANEEIAKVEAEITEK